MHIRGFSWLVVAVGCLSYHCFGEILSGSSALRSSSQVDNAIKQVAIIGAGAGGSSTAYYLNKFATQQGLKVNITVFERSSYVGGRSTTINAFDSASYPLELGASIFVEVNSILKNATSEFGLPLKQRDATDESAEVLGIWDGNDFVFTQQSSGWAWWDITKLLWKYGLAPIRTQRLMKSTVAKFLKLYEAPNFPFRSLSDRAHELELTQVTALTGEQYLAQNGISGPFANHIIQASTRVNYGQNLGLIHGLETMVCMAIEGAMQIDGGNWQIFDRMLAASGATVHLNTTVRSIKSADEDNKFTLVTSPPHSSTSSSSSSASSSSSSTSSHATSDSAASSPPSFDALVLAAPLQFAGLDLADGLLGHVPDAVPYVTLHVTLFTSPLRLDPAFFGLSPPPPEQSSSSSPTSKSKSKSASNAAAAAAAPETVLTTLAPDEEDLGDQRRGVGRAGFFSISTLRVVVNPATGVDEFAYKIFSPEKLSGDFVARVLGIPTPIDLDHVTPTSNSLVTWYHAHEWFSYPYEYPRLTFEEVQLARGIYYTSGIESFISTMETSSLMGMNVARLIVDDFMGGDGSVVGDEVVAEEEEEEEEEEEKKAEKGEGQQAPIREARVDL